MIYHWRINYKSQITNPFSMVEKILIYERDAFFALNGSDSAFLDRFMWIFTGKAVWLPLAFLILLVLIYKKELAWVIIDPIGDRIGGYAARPVLPLTSVSLSSPVSARLPSWFYGSGENCFFRIPGRTLRIYFQPCCERFRFRDSYSIDHAG